VSGAIRYNANYKDLNRNYKDWLTGEPTGSYGPRQKETQHFMDLQAAETFVLGANLHGGEEVCNYPWDNSYTPTADDAWWFFVCREYVDTLHLYNPSSFTGYNNGIVRGCNWYVINNGRQDYANYYDHTREFTLEISSTKTPSASTLPNYWNWNYRSFLNYTQQATYGIHGVVTDVCSGEPLYAKVFVNSHDVNESYIMTDPRVGFYARLIKGGTYSITYSADGYVFQTVSITVEDKQKVVQDISLFPVGVVEFPVANFETDVAEVFVNETVQFTDLSENATAWEWFFEGGTPETSTEQNPTVLYEKPGSFDVKLKASNNTCDDELIMEDFITVKQIPELPPIANFEADKTKIFEKETVVFNDHSVNVIA
jgi:PKD repeat protein